MLNEIENYPNEKSDCDGCVEKLSFTLNQQRNMVLANQINVSTL